MAVKKSDIKKRIVTRNVNAAIKRLEIMIDKRLRSEWRVGEIIKFQIKGNFDLRVEEGLKRRYTTAGWTIRFQYEHPDNSTWISFS